MLEWLKTILGDAYTEEIDKKVSAEIGKNFVSRADFNTLNETKKTLEKQISDRDKQIEDLKKVDPAKLQEEITRLQNENKEAKEKYESDLAAARLDSALELGIAKARGKNVKAIKALIDTSKLSLKDDGTVEGLDAALDALKKSDGYLFEQVETKPEGNGFRSGEPNPDSPEAKEVADAFAAARGNFFTV
jgi:regulator of replication initiation timing